GDAHRLPEPRQGRAEPRLEHRTLGGGARRRAAAAGRRGQAGRRRNLHRPDDPGRARVSARPSAEHGGGPPRRPGRTGLRARDRGGAAAPRRRLPSPVLHLLAATPRHHDEGRRRRLPALPGRLADAVASGLRAARPHSDATDVLGRAEPARVGADRPDRGQRREDTGREPRGDPRLRRRAGRVLPGGGRGPRRER
ncbi:hypothetical protein EMIHUDRAFT_452851, partial [Emiliania huxleyi CCMP1516]|uniref:Uncharacterized protein n=2 Tax=Emiliania huxleyi TaxID=2903 RepID=A0A0D3IF12_EMIH1